MTQTTKQHDMLVEETIWTRGANSTKAKQKVDFNEFHTSPQKMIAHISGPPVDVPLHKSSYRKLWGQQLCWLIHVEFMPVAVRIF